VFGIVFLVLYTRKKGIRHFLMSADEKGLSITDVKTNKQKFYPWQSIGSYFVGEVNFNGTNSREYIDICTIDGSGPFSISYDPIKNRQQDFEAFRDCFIEQIELYNKQQAGEPHSDGRAKPGSVQERESASKPMIATGIILIILMIAFPVTMILFGISVKKYTILIFLYFLLIPVAAAFIYSGRKSACRYSKKNS
jgi:hypothetical protein